MGAEDDHAGCARQNIAEDKLERVRIVGCDADCGLVLMVLLMNVRVDGLPVQEAMRHVEEEILTHHAEDDLTNEDSPGRDALPGYIEVEGNAEDLVVAEGEGSDDQKIDDVDSDRLWLEVQVPVVWVFLPGPATLEDFVALEEGEFIVVNERID